MDKRYTKLYLDTNNLDYKKAFGLLARSRFNDYDIGLVVLHAIGMTIKNQNLILNLEEESQNKLISNMTSMYTAIEANCNLFIESDYEILELESGLGYFSTNCSNGNKNDNIIINHIENDSDYLIQYCINVIKNGDNINNFIIAFGQLSRATLSDNCFSFIFHATMENYINNNNSFQTDGAIWLMTPIVELCGIVMEKY